ncbi:MAG: triose-phosphate isomerase [bacterium]|jgi:triosephosphate isomerase
MKTLIVGNWKMHLNTHDASLLVKRLNDQIKTQRSVDVVLAPNMLVLQPISLEIDRRKFGLAAQNAYSVDEGAYTGEVSFTMLRDLVDYVIVGHSERRIYFNESNDVIRDKIQASVRNEISPILCVGETKQEKLQHETRRVIHDQVTTALANLTSEEIDKVVIAYEPVWAISTFQGEQAKPSDIEPIFELIRSIVSDLYGHQVAENLRLLYGGSVTSDTVSGYLKIRGCNGALVGGASINYKEFSGIVEQAYALKNKA